jgi:virulence-associated protein VapD
MQSIIVTKTYSSIDGFAISIKNVQMYRSYDGLLFDSEEECLKHEKDRDFEKSLKMFDIETACIQYNKLIEEYKKTYPESAVDDILKMLRRVKREHGCSETTRKTD